MMALLAGGVLGLWLGMAGCGCGLWDTRPVRRAMAFRPSDLLRRVLLALGWATVLTAFLSWLAVIDVDLLTVLPLHGGTLLGGVVFGAAAGMGGLLPGTAPVALGGGRFLEGLCCMAGCALGAALLPGLQPVMQQLQRPWVQGTLFRVTLDENFLLPGGFLAQGCIGGALILLALLLPREEKAVIIVPTTPVAEQEEPPSTDAEDVQADTVIALLPGEETVVVDAAAEDAVDDTPETQEDPDDAEDNAADPPVPPEDQLG